MNPKLKLLLVLCLSALMSSCTGPDYQTTAQLISSLGQSAASVLSAQYQAMSYGGTGGYGSPNNGGYDYSQQMPSEQGYAPTYQTAGYPDYGGYQPQQPMCMPPSFFPQQPVYY